MPIALSDEALAVVMDAARPLPSKDCDAFLRDIAAELERHPAELGPGAVHRIARETQRRYFDPPRFADALSAPRPRR